MKAKRLLLDLFWIGLAAAIFFTGLCLLLGCESSVSVTGGTSELTRTRDNAEPTTKTTTTTTWEFPK